MRTTYDILFITTIPAFYKVNLFNSVAKRKRILVVYTGSSTGIRSKDFISHKYDYECVMLKKPLLAAIFQFLKISRKAFFNRVVISGWDNVISFLAAIMFPKKINTCIVESSVFESVTNGFRSFPKRFLLNHVSLVYASGTSQRDLVQKLGFNGPIVEFGGCGILNYQPQPVFEKRNRINKFLYVGQLVEKKNVQLLLDYFNEHPEFSLSIIGDGIQKEFLRSFAHDNIVFHGAINNEDLPPYYKDADVFILPSKIEPWGLVVEEALNNGTPVIVSTHVGCAQSIVLPNEVGMVFENDSKQSLADCIKKIQDVNYYNQLRHNVSLLDFNSRADNQIQCFCE